MSKISYFLATFAESALSVFGIRGTYDHPGYRVLTLVAPGIEIRAYGPRTVAETSMGQAGDGDAFGRLFGYITGANAANRTIAMTVPVEQARQEAPADAKGAPVMRFFLPPAVTGPGAPPPPSDPAVRLVTLPGAMMAVLRYTGSFDLENRARHLAQLRSSLAASGRTVIGDPIDFAYDPPFTIPFLRRNEVALPVAP